MSTTWLGKKQQPGVWLMWMSRQVHIKKRKYELFRHTSNIHGILHKVRSEFPCIFTFSGFTKSGQNSFVFSHSVNSLQLAKRTRIGCTTFEGWRIVFELIKTKTTFLSLLAGAKHLEYQQTIQILNTFTCSMYV